MKLTLFFWALSIFFFSGILSGQTKSESTLLQKVNNSKTSLEKCNTLNELSRFYLYYNPSDALERINESIELSNSISSNENYLKALINKGFYFLRIDNYDEAIQVLLEAKKLASNINDKKDEGEINQILARVYNGKGQYDVSMKLLLASQEQFSQANDYDLIGRVSETLGDINDKFGNTHLAVKYLQRSITEKTYRKDTMEISRSYSYLGNVYARELNFEKAIAYYDTAIELSNKYLNFNSLSYAYARKAKVFLELKRHNEAEEYLNKALTIAEKQKNYWLMTRIAVSQSKLLENKNQLDNALSKALNGLKISKETKDDEGQSFCYRQLTMLYRKLGDYQNGFRMLEKLEVIKNKIWSNNVTSIIATKELELKNKLEVDQLLKEQEQKEILSTKEKEADERVLFIMVLLIIIVVIFGLYFIYKYRIERKQKKLIAKQSNDNYLLLKSFSQQDQNTSLNQIASGIAHEVNSPLSAVQSSAQAIQTLIKNVELKALTELEQDDIDLFLEIAHSKKNAKNYIGKERRERAKLFLKNLDKHTNLAEHELKELATKFSEMPYDINEETFLKIIKSKNKYALLSSLHLVGKIEYFSTSSYEAAQRISDKIKELKNYLLLEQKDSISRLNLQKSVQKVIDLFLFEIEGKIKISMHIPIDIEFDFNSSKFYQIIYNLLKNAIEAINDENLNGEINILAEKNQNELLIKFINNGPAIPTKYIENIFEFFFTTKDGATGLGLSIVKNHIESFNGYISVESNEGSTTFTVVIPNS